MQQGSSWSQQPSRDGPSDLPKSTGIPRSPEEAVRLANRDSSSLTTRMVDAARSLLAAAGWR